MSKEMVISSNRHETRVALLEDDQLVEVHFQRAHEYSLAGSIHKGRVTRVLPGMQSAFVDLGLERDTFLYVSDFLEEHEDEDIDHVTGPGTGPSNDRPMRDRGRDRRPQGQASQTQSAAPPRPAMRPPAERTLAERPLAEQGAEAPISDEPSPLAQNAPPQASQDRSAPDRSASPRTDARPDARNEVRSEARPDGRGTPDGRSSDGRGNDDRRGRRSRRRRNRRGLPESKYAEPSGVSEEPVAVSQPVSEPEAAVFVAPEPSVAPMILPGESLRKYRSAPEATPATPVPAAVPELPEEDETDFEVKGVDEFNLPVHYPPENALPDAPVHHPAPVETPSHPVPVEATFPGVEAPPVAASKQSAEAPMDERHSEHLESDHSDSDHLDSDHLDSDQAEGDGGPAVASLLDEDEDLDIQAMILGEVEDFDGPESGEESTQESDLESGPEASQEESMEAGDDAGGEVSLTSTELGTEAGGESGGVAGAEPEGGTAEVRERGSRYPHRGSRRGRRRPRGPQEGRSQDARPQDGRTPDARPQETSVAEGRSEVRGEQPAPQLRERIVSRPAGPPQASGQPSISDLLKEGQEIIVQIAKEPLGQKGARITSHIALPGRYVVYMPTLEHMGVSRKIESDEERLRLKRILQGRRPGLGGGFITRTAAEGRTEEEIAADMDFLYKLWQDIKNKAERKPAPLLLHHDLDIVQRVLRDQLTDSFKSIWIDNEELYENIMSFVQRFQPGLVGKVKLYTREAPIFDAFGITAELEKALRPKVWLKSGGYIVINQTEALVAIDVNTGKYVGKSNRLEDTIVKTNTEAIKEIVRQIRLRDLGGIIVIDFIDMDERKNRQKVMQVLEEAMRVDRAPYKILQFNDFGLVAITRKRVKQSLERTLCSPCPHCDGGGYIKSVTTVVGEILTEARKMASSVEGKEVVLRTHPDVAKVLKSNQNKYLEELEEVLRRPVLIKSDPLLHNEKFDLA